MLGCKCKCTSIQYSEAEGEEIAVGKSYRLQYGYPVSAIADLSDRFSISSYDRVIVIELEDYCYCTVYCKL